MNPVLACIDGGPQTQGVCDYASWAARRVSAPLRFLHVLDRQPEHALVHDLSGNIGVDAQETLLAELTQLDENRSRVAQRHGRELLDAARRRAVDHGLPEPEVLQRHGNLVDTILELEDETRLVVLGQHPVPGSVPRLHLDQDVERVVRSLNKPVLVTTTTFREPERVIIAFDGSATGRKLIDALAASPFLQDLEGILITAGPDIERIAAEQQWAVDTLRAAGFNVEARHQTGNAEAVLQDQIQKRQADLLIMGAYGHSRIREFIVGSTTTTLLRTSAVPVLILR